MRCPTPTIEAFYVRINDGFTSIKHPLFLAEIAMRDLQYDAVLANEITLPTYRNYLLDLSSPEHGTKRLENTIDKVNSRLLQHI